MSSAKSVVAVDGSIIKCAGEAKVIIEALGAVITVGCLLLEEVFSGADAVLGMDFIVGIGGVNFSAAGVRREEGGSSKRIAATAVSEQAERCTIVDRDFEAVFDGEKWTAKWRWKAGEEPILKNRISEYASTEKPDTKEDFDREVRSWISKGWLVPCETSRSEGLLPLMAVIQRHKGKVRPVLDYRELNGYVESHPGADVAVCDEAMRRWRRKCSALKIIDLKSAYLQICIDASMWRFQRVQYAGRTFTLTRLGFGLNCAPKIMSAIVRCVLRKDRMIESATDAFMDDILVDESIVPCETVVAHLKRYGLEAKPPESLDGGRALGLVIVKDHTGCLQFRRGNGIPRVPEKMTRRQVFSLCGQLTGHYPVGGWLRIACSFLKRESGAGLWGAPVSERVAAMLRQLVERVEREDPVRGPWHVPETTRGRVWCDASSIALGAAIEIGGAVVEDGAWLRKPADVGHINTAELEAVIKGINLATKWRLKDIELMTDSATVKSWLDSVLSDASRPKVSGMAEMLVRRRLGLVGELVKAYNLTVRVVYVPSEKNKADVLTRVSKQWVKCDTNAICGVTVDELHKMNHLGVDRTLNLARMVNADTTRAEVERCVKACERCATIDPAPAVHEEGCLEVSQPWIRLAIDFTHYGAALYLTIVDCGPGRFAVWREVAAESSDIVVKNIEQVFRERGPPRELLMDNGTAFRSRSVQELCARWGVFPRFRAAYRPAGNGIVERNHRTVKRIAARSQISPLQAAFWYNLASEGTRGKPAPSSAVFAYRWRHPAARTAEMDGCDRPVNGCPFETGDAVFVKPPGARCTTEWPRGRVDSVVSTNNVVVDGMPRHVLDLRKVPEQPTSVPEELRVDHGDLPALFEETEAAEARQTEGDRPAAGQATGRSHLQRIQRRPARLQDFVMCTSGERVV